MIAALQIRGSEFSAGSALVVRGSAAVALLLDMLLQVGGRVEEACRLGWRGGAAPRLYSAPCCPMQAASPTWPVVWDAALSRATRSSEGGSSTSGAGLVPLATFALPSAGANDAVRTLAAPGTLGARLDLPQILSPTPFRHGAAPAPHGPVPRYF